MQAQRLTVPNALSALRLLLVPVIASLLATQRHDVLSLLLLVVAGVTDWLDGWLARRWNQVTTLGVLLDPLADRLALIAFSIALLVRGAVPWWAMLALIIRDGVLLFTLPALRARGVWALPVSRLGKAATFALLCSLPLCFAAHAWTPIDSALSRAALALLCIGVLAYWGAGFGYLREVRRLNKVAP